jgi:hypothetical protein
LPQNEFWAGMEAGAAICGWETCAAPKAASANRIVKKPRLRKSDRIDFMERSPFGESGA